MVENRIMREAVWWKTKKKKEMLTGRSFNLVKPSLTLVGSWRSASCRDSSSRRARPPPPILRRSVSMFHVVFEPFVPLETSCADGTLELRLDGGGVTLVAVVADQRRSESVTPPTSWTFQIGWLFGTNLFTYKYRRKNKKKRQQTRS